MADGRSRPASYVSVCVCEEEGKARADGAARVILVKTHLSIFDSSSSTSHALFDLYGEKNPNRLTQIGLCITLTQKKKLNSGSYIDDCYLNVDLFYRPMIVEYVRVSDYVLYIHIYIFFQAS